eukprot:1326843-Amphidinium_carterae.2
MHTRNASISYNSRCTQATSPTPNKDKEWTTLQMPTPYFGGCGIRLNPPRKGNDPGGAGNSLHVSFFNGGGGGLG